MAPQERFFVTGALGCIGAWVVRHLVREGVEVTVFDLGQDRRRLALVMEPEELARVRFVHGDITDTEAVCRALEDAQATHVVHLAALQVPFCKARPPLGAAVNVVGTVNLFEAAKALGLGQVVYASSFAVYGRRSEYTHRILPPDAEPRPFTHYGVYKLANEGNARVYWQDDGIASIGLRPYTVYGPGRDQGMTSAPTQAMLAAVQGRPFHIPFGGVCDLQYVDDVARIFVQAARTPVQGALVFNLRGSIVPMQEVISAIEAVEPRARGLITHGTDPLPFPDGAEDEALRSLLGEVPQTPLREGVARTMEHFRQALARGTLPQGPGTTG